MKNLLNSLFFALSLVLIFSQCTTSENDSSSESTLTGSYSTMLTIKNFLYLVNKTEITTFDVSDSKNPIKIDHKNLGFDIESLFNYNDLLLVGSRTRMYILKIDNSGIPVLQSTTNYNNLSDCSRDPIVARQDIAYVTLSSEQINLCNRPFLDELRVYDIGDLSKPLLLSRHAMKNPKGLGLGKQKLYICDLQEGLVVYDLKNPLIPVLQQKFEGFEAFDVIIQNNLLIVSAKNELRQYDISNEDDIKYIGRIQL